MSETEATNPAADEDVIDTSEDTGVADEAHAQGDDHQDTSDEADSGQSEDEEIELEGKRYRVPKELKDGFLRQADYTRKTQEVAETRRDVEARAAALAKDAETVKELREEYGTQHALKARVDYYTQVDWQTYSQQNPQAAQADWMAYQQAKDALKETSETISKKETELTQAREREIANARQQTEQVLAKSIPDWGPQKVQEIVQFASKELGVKPEELRDTDARTWHAIERLRAAEAELAKLKNKQATQKRAEAVQQVKPAVSVKGSAPSTGLADNLSTAEWVRRRNAQLAKSR